MSPPPSARIEIVPVLIANLAARFPAPVLAVLEVAWIEVGADDALVELGARDVAEGGEGVVVVEESGRRDEVSLSWERTSDLRKLRYSSGKQRGLTLRSRTHMASCCSCPTP